ncbi:NUDIX hydrolase [Maribacter sp. X9]|uniref:NUDIX hydrolase n=1 Tax=Maribacter sp. X9 TaxID=3402159 RepID=UPI003AF3979C
MDELIDILTDNGEPTGTRAMKTEAHRKGLFHPTVHIWFYTSDGKILLQKRAENKDTHPGLWDVSVAGHIGAGENILDSALREIAEEIGLSISETALQKIGIFKSVQKHSESLIDCEFHHTFLSELKFPLEKLTKQESEVNDLKLLSIKKLEDELLHPDKSKIYVPHSQTYYSTIVSEIKKLL